MRATSRYCTPEYIAPKRSVIVRFFDDFAFAANGVDDGEGVVAVDALGMHAIRVDAQAYSGQHPKAHGLAHGLTAHAIEVVHEIEEHGRRTADLFGPEGTILVHGRDHHPFPDRPTAHAGVANVGDDDAGPPVDALEERAAHGNVPRSADDGVVGHHAKGREESMHGAAHALVEAGATAEYFGKCTIQHKVD